MKEKTNYTTVAKIAHAGINSKGYNERTGVVRFQRLRPALTIDPATRFWWLSGENGLMCIITCTADSNRATKQTVDNFKYYTTWNLSVSYNKELFKWWNLTANGDAF
ncbi:hypothetical protein [Mucilaginibacter polytrichastri]|uniref:Uncharacterized protein n=1 Tax=Mucilaginibacter polytrichastri TaxID=1302689 RepID=A0A1Q5ZWB5_9SPHI|nr:hypothetical protein [Mucilaginibacter polytrichastri]OKS86033.1 hypothetical protein RG47T_1480 [Mucilaginibacter polytrichastri]SFS59507.1 hypothetical protein SAMN04487890_102105 [Mucilaginibacter polytrichastri]